MQSTLDSGKKMTYNLSESLDDGLRDEMIERKKITLYEIAQLAGTSKSTVSRVLMNQSGVSQETRRKIEQIMREKGYHPNQMARGLAGGRTGMIAVVTPGIFSGYYAEILKGVDVVAGNFQVHVISSFARGEKDYPALINRFSQPGQVDGLILVAPRLDIFQQRAPRTSVPIVLIGAYASENGWDRLDRVTLNNVGAMNEVLDHLKDQGCKRLLHLTGPSGVHDFAERRRGFEEYIQRNPELRGIVLNGGDTRATAREALEKFLKENPRSIDAVVACNDDMAMGALQVLRGHGIRIPEEVAVTGCDDEAASEVLGLTTIHMPMVELGEEATRLLFERRKAGQAPVVARQSILQMSLVVRSTSSRKTPIRS
jgi:DNA-binding LacI/PurR family transcriptional regulator